MKFLISLFLTLLPLPALAFVSLANCDHKDYDVTIRKAGQTYVKRLPDYGVIHEYGPDITLELPPYPPVRAHQPHSEYCVWNGSIRVQRLYLTDSSGL